MSNNEVIEATAALKGILGIGKVVDSNDTKQDDTSNKNQKVFSKKKKGKKKKKFTQGGDQTNAHVGNQKHQQNLHEQNQNPNSVEKNNIRTKKSNHLSPVSTSSAKAKKKVNSNFAWSAFQSPPSASSLPLPAFSGSDLFSDSQTCDETPSISHEQLENNNLVDLSVVAKSVEQLENEVIAAAEAAAALKKKENTSVSSENFDELTKKEQEKERSEENKNQTSQQSEKAQSTIQKKHNETKKQSGVNLAALTSSHNTVQKTSSAFSNDVSNTTQMNATKSLQLQSNTQAHLPSHISTQNPYSHPQHHQQQHYSQQHQIVTIQVQIPPVLLPGRQMMVHTPAGYPIPVVVPESMRPGMIIPVNVPAPMNLHPHHAQHSPQMHPHQQINQYHYSNQNLPQRQYLNVTPFNLGQDPYYPYNFDYSKPSPGNDPASKN